jgi:hypothetical protein
MKMKPHPDRDLGDLLQTWKVESRDDPALSVRVWERIGDSKEGELPGWMQPVFGWFLRPAGMIAVVTTFVFVGAALGQWSFSGGRDAAIERLATEYVRSIDPVLMAGQHQVFETE